MGTKAIVAIDGPAGSGKSTVARGVAEALGLPNLETGAMYRALTWAVLRDGIDPSDAASVSALAARARIEVDRRVLVDGEDVTAAIRSPEVTAAVSAVSAVPGARDALVRRQQAWIDAHGPAVVEGRDIGTVVAPDAVLKIFLVASAEERARRRHAEDNPAQAEAATLEDIRRRDLHDSSRPVAPLAAAPDAVVLDTTGRPVDDVIAEVVARFRDALPGYGVSPENPVSPETKAEPAARPPRWVELAVYAVARGAVAGLSRALWRARVVHRERLPAAGPYVLAPSHRSNLDSPFLGCVTRRRIRFMGKAELWRHGWSARLFSALGGFPVNRGVPDRAALRAALAALEGGEPLAVFPEGTRRHGPRIENLHDGVAYVAARLGVPVVPVGIGGSEEILARGRKVPKFTRVVIVIGEPLQPPPRPPGGSVRRRDVAELTERLRSALQAVFDEAQALARPGVRGCPPAGRDERRGW